MNPDVVFTRFSLGWPVGDKILSAVTVDKNIMLTAITMPNIIFKHIYLFF